MQPLKLVILGATGGTGRQLVAQALEAGHHVTAYVRAPAKLPNPHERLRGVEGSVAEGAPGLAAAMREQDAVISTLGVGASLQSGGLIRRSVPAILSAMQSSGVRRLIFTSAIGVGDAARDAPLLSRIMIRLLLSDIYADKGTGEELIRRSNLDWTIVQPARLTDGPLTGTYRAGEGLKHRPIATIARADVAHFLLGQLGDAAYVRKTVRIGY